MAEPVVTVRVDWGNDGAFDGAYDDVSASLIDGLSWTRGRSADFSAEATGQAQFTLSNHDDRFTPDRNWHDNPSFEAGTVGWSVGEIGGLFGAGTSITQVTDNAGQGGTKAGEAVFPAAAAVAFQADSFQSDTFPLLTTAGVSYPIRYPFRSGVTYAVRVWLKSVSGALTVRAGLASAGTPADIASSAANVTTSWAAYAFTWTPTADRSDAVFFVRTTAAAAATVRIDAVQVNAGSSANAYLEAPTKGQLVPGRPVHIYASYGGTDYPEFYGYIQRLAPDPRGERSVTVTCYDVLQRMAETDVVVAPNAFVNRSARDFRREVLEDFERGTRNLIANPSFETDITSWTGAGLARVTTDHVSGAACAEVTTASTVLLEGAVKLAPIFFAGEVYRFSVYLRTTSGTTTADIGFGEAAEHSRVVTVTDAWQRFTHTFTVPATLTASEVATPLQVRVRILSASTVRIDAASVTRGQALYPYADTGTGRSANWVGNGSFDSGTLNGWYDDWKNGVTNGSFETNTSGWAVTADAFHTAATSITRVAGGGYHGAAYAAVEITATGQGAHYVVTGTYLSGVTYRLTARTKFNGAQTLTLGVGSQGTPADFASQAIVQDNTWKAYSVAWTPSGDRTDVHVYVSGTSIITFAIDAVMLTVRDLSVTYPLPYSDTGPGGGSTAAATTSTTAKYGALSQSFTTTAVAGSGRVYDLGHLGGYFVAGQAYTASLWVYPSSDMAYQVGLAGSLAAGTFEDANDTGTATANTWTQLTVTWTPSVDFANAVSHMGYLYLRQTDTTARTVLVDGVRLIPGSTADDYEMTHWDLSPEGDVYNSSAYLGGSALSALGTINAATLTRHWIEPAMATPWYAYVTAARDDAKASVETFGDADIVDMGGVGIERESIVNIVPVVLSTGKTIYYSDETSVNTYGPRPTGTIGGGTLGLSVAVADVVGTALLARYRDPRARPALTVVNLWPSQMTVELDDLVTVTCTRLQITGGQYLVQAITSTVGGDWTTVYVLEEA